MYVGLTMCKICIERDTDFWHLYCFHFCTTSCSFTTSPSTFLAILHFHLKQRRWSIKAVRSISVQSGIKVVIGVINRNIQPTEAAYTHTKKCTSKPLGLWWDYLHLPPVPKRWRRVNRKIQEGDFEKFIVYGCQWLKNILPHPKFIEPSQGHPNFSKQWQLCVKQESEF